MKTQNNFRVLRIAQIAPLWTRVPPRTYGGAELMVYWLTEELVQRGHEVTLFAAGDSETSAQLRSVCRVHLIEAMERGEAYQYECYANANVAEALRESDAFDIIHCHVGPATIPLSRLSKVPMLHTIHAGLDSVDELWVLQQYPEVPIAAISYSQVEAVSIERRQTIRVVYHGCDFEAYEPSFTPGTYLMFLGRMGPHKNPLDAIRIAQAVGLPIVLVGKAQDRHEERYFQEKIKPLIDGTHVRYLGAVSHAQKVKLLRGASALIFPIQWDEHFGLVMIEAMACGTPVVACDRGSVREVVDIGTTGFYATSVDALIPLVSEALSLDRKMVWQHAMRRFSHKRMTNDYVNVYELLIRSHEHHTTDIKKRNGVQEL
jgi:glycosyltransferase involved in cell wall biosynthesis